MIMSLELLQDFQVQWQIFVWFGYKREVGYQIYESALTFAFSGV